MANKETRALFDDNVNIGKRVSNQCEHRGLIVPPVGHLNVLSPPLVMNRDQIDFTIKVLRENIAAVMAELGREGVRSG